MRERDDFRAGVGACGRGVGITVNPIALLRDPIGELKRALHIER